MDFSQLDNDQLLQLIQAAWAEAVNRGAAMAYAAQQTQDDAAEALRIKAEAAAAEAARKEALRAEKIRKQAEAEVAADRRQKEAEENKMRWAKKRAIFDSLLCHPLFEDERNNGTEFSVNIWSRDTDVRVYIQAGRSGSIFDICYYQTGNRYNPPGAVTGVQSEDDAADLADWCEALLKRWHPGLRVNRQDVNRVATGHPAYNQDYQAYCQALDGHGLITKVNAS